MVLDRTDVAAVGNPDGERERHPGAVVVLGRVAHDLVEGGVDEPVELDFGNRPKAAQRQPDGRADDGRLGQWRVEDPLLPELLLQPIRHPEDATQAAHVFPKEQHPRVCRQRVAQSGIQGFGQRDSAHSDGSRVAANSSRSA